MKRINLCEYCGKGKEYFDDATKFKNHSCRNKTEVFCKECDMCFASNLILRRHLESVHQGIVYNCKTCNKLFKSLAAMTRHSKTHKESLKKHECDTCKKVFSRNEHLRKHTEKCYPPMNTNESQHPPKPSSPSSPTKENESKEMNHQRGMTIMLQNF